MKLALDFVAVSDRGLVRANNEDSAYAGPHLLVLADGMGGHAAGEVASQLMVEHLEHLDRDPEDADMLALLGAAAEDGNASIEASVAEHPEQAGMGTTLTAAMFNGRELGLIHVGDSRGYLLRDGELRQLTVDDTFVQSLVNDGKLAPEDVSSHPQKSLILKAYTGRAVEPHLELIQVQPGDRVLLCSDGLSDPVTQQTIQLALGDGTPEMAANRLIELALRSGGPDNVTVVVAEVVEATEGDAARENRAVVRAGALDPGYESSHPDSAASRAAALLRKSETITPDHNRAKLQDADASDDEEGHTSGAVGVAGKKQPSSVWPWVVATLVLLLVLAVAGVMWSQSRATDEYTLSYTKQSGVKGAPYSIFEPVRGITPTPLPRGTAYLTDAGMCGDYDSVIGMDKLEPISRFVTGMTKGRFTPAEGPVTLSGVFVETDDATGRARSVAPVRVGGRLADSGPPAS